MASHFAQPGCAICKQPVDLLEKHFRASGDFLPAGDPLTPIANAPMHWACYAGWPERPRFARHYVQAWIKANRRNPFWWSVWRDDRVYVSINPQRPVEEASVRLMSVGSDIRVPLPRWANWLREPEQITPGLQEIEREALAEVLPTLRRQFPDDYALVHAIDPDEKRPRARRESLEEQPLRT